MAKEQEFTECGYVKNTEPSGEFTAELASFVEDTSIRISTGGEERIRIDQDGKFYVNEQLVETDKQVYEGFVAFLKDAGWY